MKDQRRFAPKGVRITPESVSGFTGICTALRMTMMVVVINQLLSSQQEGNRPQVPLERMQPGGGV